MSNLQTTTNRTEIAELARASSEHTGTIMVEEFHYGYRKVRRLVPKFLDGEFAYVCTGKGGSIKRLLASAVIINKAHGLATFRFED